jgi:hypothetical protein
MGSSAILGVSPAKHKSAAAAVEAAAARVSVSNFIVTPWNVHCSSGIPQKKFT